MLSRTGFGIGVLWCLLLCVTAWTWGGGDDPNEDLVDRLWLLLLSALVLVSAYWAAVLVREKRGRWLLAAVPSGALLGMVVLMVGADRRGIEPEIPGFFFLMFVVVLSVPFVVGAAVARLRG